MMASDIEVIPLMVRAITGVIKNAEDGELPLFACTLGLRQSTLQEALRLCAPERLASHPMPDDHYQVILQSCPEQHAALVELLLAGRSSQANPQHAEWLASSLLDKYSVLLSAWLKAEACNPLKQRRNLKQLHLDLKELGYEGSYDRVAAFARQWKVGQSKWVNSASKRT